ncbi:MAG: hypothetical protein FWD12_09060, partial [Alphaproteobacteria bacterium]|nr:hypothetical protein [Alphaproteobacteria bacterium]
RAAAAEARATEVVSRAIAEGQVTAINYFVADKYLRALTEIAHSPNQKVVMLPIEVTAVLGSLGGIAEIAKATFGSGPAGSGPAGTTDPGAGPGAGAVNGAPRPGGPITVARPPGSDTTP